MSRTLKFSECEPSLEFTAVDFENWKRRTQLRTEYAPTVPGSARYLNEENALELALIGAFIRCNVPLNGAVALADPVRRSASVGAKVREFVVFRAGDYDSEKAGWSGIASDDTDAIVKVAENSDATAISVVMTGAILRKVRKLFAAQGEA